MKDHTHTLPPSERPKDECGVFAVFGHEDAARLTYFGLYALQVVVWNNLAPLAYSH